MEGYELIGELHVATYGLEGLSVSRIFVVPLVVVEVTVEAQPDASVLQRYLLVYGVVVELFEAAESQPLAVLDDASP